MSDPSYDDYANLLRSELIEVHFEALYEVSRVISRSLDFRDGVQQILKLLHDRANLMRGLVVLTDPNGGELLASSYYDGNAPTDKEVRYRPGEGLVGEIVAAGKTIVIEQLGQEPRFLDRLGLYNPKLPFIGVPIILGQEQPVGALAAQPPGADDGMLEERARFLEMVANLISQQVHLSRKVAEEKKSIVAERDQLRMAVKGNYGFHNIVGHTPAMRRLFEQIRQVAKWNTTVLIRGDSGTGKELIANAIHYNSPRANGQFIKLNCAALPDNLLESELFGHEKGAFTGAMSQRKGRFEQADRGTLFLDEIGEITPAFQAKLLRVLQEGEFERVGGTKTIKVDVRIIAATNRNLEEAVELGEFREDLYYRLNVVPLFTPSLRERLADIPDLTEFLLGKIGNNQGRALSITNEAIRLLMGHDWPGNVRELENVVERAAIMCEDGQITDETLSLMGFGDRYGEPPALVASPLPQALDLNDPTLDERERIVAALEQAGWVQAKAARLLNMTPRQIAYRIQTMGIEMRRI